jgi:hypothetical protein
VTLLLFNSIANEALPIFLAELVPSYMAVLLSVTAILIFGCVRGSLSLSLSLSPSPPPSLPLSLCVCGHQSTRVLCVVCVDKLNQSTTTPSPSTTHSEIIPSALFTGPNQIVMASRLSGFVYLLMGLFYPIACPIAWVLDRWLGGHHTFKRYTREEVRAFVGWASIASGASNEGASVARVWWMARSSQFHPACRRPQHNIT